MFSTLNNLGGVLDDEWLKDVNGVLAIILAPLPGLVKDDVARHDDALRDRVIVAVGLAALFVAEKDGRGAAVVELVLVRARVLDVGDAAEGAEVVDHRLFSVLGLIWGLAIECTCWSPVQDVDGGGDSLAPEVRWEPFCLQHVVRHGDHSLVAALNHSVLLGSVWSGELLLDIALRIVLPKLHGGELPP
jgi:hypothetical protein